jgi:hypothetical protein|tara:strand:+ start:3684 stop:4028 length:345 start_codon:yes stop_codon:yes gene_type:complete
MNKEKNKNQWKINYLYREQKLGEKILMGLYSEGLEPEYKEREVERITLKQYIEFIGIKPAAELFGCSIASTKAWRYGLRQPSIDQAKKIIKASNGKLDFESIFGPIEDTKKTVE